MVFDDRVQRSGDLGMLVAQIAALDIVVSVDDLVLALASAMGKRAFKLAGGNEHWSWGREGTQSSWWPNITIIRADGGNLVRSIATAHAEVARLAANARVIRSV